MVNKTKILFLFMSIIGLCSISEVAAKVEKTRIEPQKAETGKVIAFYFHGNFRCTKCKKIEQYSYEAIEKYFTEQIKTKQLIFNIINIDLPENKHFIEDYQLYTRSLVIADFKDGKQVKWKNLTKVWDYLNDRDKFYQYIQLEIQKYLEHI